MTETFDKARAAVKRLKVFPLPPVTLLPGSALPLHIFEPRYREMLKDALASDSLFAMAHVLPGQESLLPTSPALEEMVCIGSVTVHEEAEGGRSNLVLVGIARARLLKELPQAHAYREFEAELVEDELVEPEADERLRRAVVDLVARVDIEVGQRIAQVTSRVVGGQLADVVASIVIQDPAQRFEVLQETDVRERIEVVTEELLGIIGHIKPRKPEGLMN